MCLLAYNYEFFSTFWFIFSYRASYALETCVSSIIISSHQNVSSSHPPPHHHHFCFCTNKVWKRIARNQSEYLIVSNGPLELKTRVPIEVNKFVI